MAEADGEDDVESEISQISLPGESDSVSFITEPSLSEEIQGSKSKEVEGVVTKQHLKDISRELGLIKLCWEDVPQVNYEDRLHHPPSYLKNNEKEKLLLWYAENFRQQYNNKYPERRPLLLACDNECDVQKLVCTTIRPTVMKFPEFETWQGCASFVADHLMYEELQSPTVLPDHLYSPQTVLRRQAGHSFEFSTLLVSFLVASSYDAYVVSGYATREVCKNVQNRVDCPFLEDEPTIEMKENVEEDTKYFLKKPPELVSQFLLEMEAREVRKRQELQRAQELAEIAAIKEFEKPLPDPLWGWRLHSWVLVLPSKDVTTPFFIESTTGLAKDVNDPSYHGIESVWNHENYWVLVQFNHKTETCKDICFDLNNPKYWERLLIGEPIAFRKLPSEMVELESAELEKISIEIEKHLDMPASWVDKLNLPHSAFESRFPQSRKVTHYRKAILEQFSPYSQPDGLVERVTRYHDYECEQPKQIRESYKNRQDKMYFCEKTIEDNSVLEKFHRGREDALKEHFYYSTDIGFESRFTLKFYNEARMDGWYQVEVHPLFVKINLKNTPDFLYFVNVEFEDKAHFDQAMKTIVKVTEKFHRNYAKDADKDVAMVEHLYKEKRLNLKFHYEPDHVTQGQRWFQKPMLLEKEARLTFDPNLTSGYLTSMTGLPPKPLYLYRLELEYFKRGEAIEDKVRERRDEILALQRLRAQELGAPQLWVSQFDVERNFVAKKAFLEKEQEMKEMAERNMTMVCDFLAPYYSKIGLPPKIQLPHKLAQQVMEQCLQDWKTLLVARANDIQQQFEQTCQEFYDKNNWYEQNQSTITKEQEEEYFEYCKRNSYYLHMLEMRLNRHKELAPQRYLAIQTYLQNDPRLVLAFSKPKPKKILR